MTQFEQRMKVLRARFVDRCGSEITALREAIQKDDRAALRRVAHSLAGNAGLFGFPELSLRARALEDILDRGGSPEEEVLAKVEAVIAEMPDEPNRGPSVQGE